MQKLKNDLTKSDRKLQENTIYKYIKDFEKITKYFLKDKQFKSYSFLKDSDKVFFYLDSLSYSQKFNLIKVICIVLNINRGKARKGYQRVLKLYQNYLTNLVKEYNKEKATGKKTNKEIANWLDWITITNHVDELYEQFYNKYFNEDGKCKVDLINCGVQNLKEVHLLMTLALYIYLPPRRLEYAFCKYIRLNEFEKLSEDDMDNNIYLVHIDINNNFISFGKNKIKNKTNKNIKINFTEKLNIINSIFINLNYFQRSQKYGNSFLFNSQLNQMSTTSLSQYLQKHFKKHFNKEVSVSMLRKSYRTHKLAPIKKLIKEAEKDSEKMNHSLQSGFTHYCKV